MRRGGSLAALLLLPLLVGCRSPLGRKLRARAAPQAARLPEPPAPAAEDVPAFLFLGLKGVLADLATLREGAAPAGRAPRLVRLSAVEDAVRRRWARGGFGGPVLSVVALGVSGRVPLAPAAMADLMTDLEVERQVLAAASFRSLGTVYALPGARKTRARATLRGVGAGPLRVALRFNAVTERRDASDGRVWLRYDPAPAPPNEHVTLYRGGCLLEPDGAGARVTEVLLLGTDLRLPPPLQGSMEDLALTTLSNRARNLWVRAWRR